jgi:hypothetical protein
MSVYAPLLLPVCGCGCCSCSVRAGARVVSLPCPLLLGALTPASAPLPLPPTSAALPRPPVLPLRSLFGFATCLGGAPETPPPTRPDFVDDDDAAAAPPVSIW